MNKQTIKNNALEKGLRLCLVVSFLPSFASQELKKRSEGALCIETGTLEKDLMWGNRDTFKIILKKNMGTALVKIGDADCSWKAAEKCVWMSGLHIKKAERNKKYGTYLLLKSIEAFYNKFQGLKTIGWCAQYSMHEPDYIPLNVLEKFYGDAGAIIVDYKSSFYGIKMHYPLKLAATISILIPYFEKHNVRDQPNHCGIDWIKPIKLIVGYCEPEKQEDQIQI